MTPQKVADISEPIEQLYSDLTDELLINIARHLSKSTATWSALHEIETLEEMGQLTQENIEIINTYVAKMPEEIKKAMNESRLEALGEIENKLQQAADNGYLTKPVTDSTVDVVQALSSQAAEQLNLVNQTMLNTSLQQYQNGIYEFRQEMQNAAPRTIESVDDLQIAQNEINIAAGKTVTGTETRYNAMRKAISNLNKAGIVGYYDRANRAWTAEAYVNMDIRTTVHNTYIQSVQTRQQDYGSDVFQVSAHAGARPLCYPYQGKLYSWGASGGTIRLGDGKTYKYEPIGETSYGEPAGLFGINCGHVPYPMIAGVSEPVKEDIQSKEENDKQYQDSQKQRALERQIRYAKRNVEMLGDLATDADRDKIKQAQAQMRAFIQSTGRTRRYDREQIVTQRGATGIKPTVKTPISSTDNKYYKKQTQDALAQIYETHRTLNNLTAVPLNELSEEDRKKLFVVNYGNIDKEVSRNFTEQVIKLSQKYDTTLKSIRLMNKNEVLGRMNAFASTYHDYDMDDSTIIINPIKCGKYDKLVNRIKELVDLKWSVNIEKEYADKYVVTHEFAHTLIEMQSKLDYKRNWLNADYGKIENARKELNGIYNAYMKEYQEVDKERKAYELDFLNNFNEDSANKARELTERLNELTLSKYALTNSDEFMAESFAQHELGTEDANEYVTQVMEVINRYFGR